MSAPTAAPTTSTRTGDPRDTLGIATLVTAFAADPVIRWLYPQAAGYLAHFPELLETAGAPAFLAGTADRVADGAGAALWVPPGTAPDDEALGELLAHTVDPERQPDVFDFLAQVQEHHLDGEHWYLPFVGVDPRRQGQGLGSTLLRQGLARCDHDRLPAYLEASTARNRALYERHGFAVIAEIQAADSPPLWPMRRSPR